MSFLDIFKSNPAESPSWDIAQQMQAGEFDPEIYSLIHQAQAKGLDPDQLLYQLISAKGRGEDLPGNPYDVLNFLAPRARAATLRSSTRALEESMANARGTEY